MGLFDQGSETYKTDVKLGAKYRENLTGIEGTATAVYFFLHACERVQLEYVNEKDGNLVEVVFDAPRLTRIDTFPTEDVRQQRTGGPDRGTPRVKNPGAR